MPTEPSESTPLSGRRVLSGAALRVRLLTAVASFAEGYDLGVINGAVVLMRDDLGLTAWQVGWAVAIFFFVAAPAVLVAGQLSDSIGRKGAVGISMAALALGNIIWACSWHFTVLLIGRGLLGAGVGMGIATVTIYISEVAPAHQRGFYTALEPFFLNIGIPIGFASGAVFIGLPFDWRLMVGIGAVPAICAGVLVMTNSFPESPRFLAAHCRYDEAHEILQDLLKAGGSLDADSEASIAVEAWRSGAVEDGTCSFWEALQSFMGPRKRMALAGVGVGCMQMLSGISVFTAFSTMVLKENGMSTRGAMRVTVSIGCVKTCTVLYVAFSLIDKWGRRPMLLLSAAIMALGSLVVSMASTMHLGAYAVSLGLLLFGFGFAAGLGPATYVYMAEVFDTRTRSKGVGIGCLVGRVINGLYSVVTPVGVATLGVGPLFLTIAGMNVVALAYLWAFCPETKGFHLEDIHELFVDKKKTDRETI